MILVEDVTRLYGSTRAVQRVSFRIGPGEIVGFLGPNGAGKSTLLKMMSTYLAPTSGRIEIAGSDTTSDSLGARASLGYLTEHNALWDGMRVDRFLVFVGRARGLARDELAGRIEWVAGRCDIGAVMRKRVAECSKGYRQRIGLAAALIHDPPVLLLDEPTHGLDPLQVVAFRDLLFELREGRAILFSSHILAEVLEISDRLLVLHQGELLCDRPLGDIEEDAAERGVSVDEVVLDFVRHRDGSGA